MKADLARKGYTVDELVAPMSGTLVYFISPDSNAVHGRWYKSFRTAVRESKKLGPYFRAVVSSDGRVVV